MPYVETVPVESAEGLLAECGGDVAEASRRARIASALR